MTGLPAAGKTTIAQVLEKRLLEYGLKAEVLDGDVIRTNLSKGLGFSREDRDAHIGRIAFVCKLLTRNGVACIAAVISPYRGAREKARRDIGNFVEVYVKCALEVLIERDVKGLYRKALAGEITETVKTVIAAYKAPKEIAFLADLPKTRSGKIMRRLLRARELGLPEGDTSTLEGAAP